jgi:bla regulator protein blaR1
MANQANFLQSLGWAVLNSLWQMALLWVVYQMITGILKHARPAAKSLLASFLLMSGFVWFLYTFFIAYAGAGHREGGLTAAILDTATSTDVSLWLRQSLPVASVIYLVLLLFPLLRFVRNFRYVQIIRRYGLSKMNVDWRIFVTKTAALMGIKRKVQTWVSELVSSPVTIGFWKPVILVPLAAINQLTPQQLEAVLLHEISHIRRNDYLVNLIINFIQTILYFNPFVKAFMKIVEREREKSCDEMVLQFQYDSHEYASALLTLEKTSHIQKPLAIAAAGKKNDLLHRVESILRIPQKPVLSFNKVAGLFAGLLCIIAVNTLLISTRPTAAKGNTSVTAFADITSPSNQFTDNYNTDSDVSPANAETDADKANQLTAKETEVSSIPSGIPSGLEAYVAAAINPAIINASLEMAEQMPALNKQQELQVKQAIEASKKIIEDVKWKDLEKNIADVFSSKEKDILKSTYEKELNKLDWKLWETKLRQAYNQVDWEKINEQLSNAVSMVRVDSLHRVYSDAISKIDQARTEMMDNNISGIPDSDVTLKTLEQKRKDLLYINSLLKGVRTKKIVRL